MADKQPGRDVVSTGEFVQCLAESGLFDIADLLPDSAQIAAIDSATAAQKLVEAGKLTEFQADAVLSRRPGDLKIGNYEILDRLGAGAMGTVFKARHRRMKRIVALKVLSREVAGSEKFALRFQREVETIAKLTHPNIVMAFDADEDETGPFLVMEFVNGRDLASEVKNSGSLSVADAVDRILQAARGLEYAHAQGIIHRDIKPGNILRDVDGVVKVADLGLARLSTSGDEPDESASLTQAGMVVGTAEYMPPEQAIDSGQVDHRADIYSLGCTLHFLLTGRAPYQAGSIMSMLLKHRDAPIPDLSSLLSDTTPELVGVFQRMVAKAPEERYQTMTEVVRELERLQSRITAPNTQTQPASAQPAAPMNLLNQPVASNQTLAGTIGDTGTFELTPGAGAQKVLQPGRVAGLTVVLVEPSRTQAGIIRRYLTQFGAGAVHATGSGQEGIEIAKRERADVLICSMHLSDMTGAALARTVVADPGCGRLGVVVATSESDAEYAAELPTDVRVKVLPKPFDFQQLTRAITSVIV
jgi:CheY-like chemotaxis protein/tRNA A-37 threonylcarbamoyl transferase component Bud32